MRACGNEIDLSHQTSLRQIVEVRRHLRFSISVKWTDGRAEVNSNNFLLRARVKTKDCTSIGTVPQVNEDRTLFHLQFLESDAAIDRMTCPAAAAAAAAAGGEWRTAEKEMDGSKALSRSSVRPSFQDRVFNPN